MSEDKNKVHWIIKSLDEIFQLILEEDDIEYVKTHLVYHKWFRGDPPTLRHYIKEALK